MQKTPLGNLWLPTVPPNHAQVTYQAAPQSLMEQQGQQPQHPGWARSVLHRRHMPSEGKVRAKKLVYI